MSILSLLLDDLLDENRRSSPGDSYNQNISGLLNDELFRLGTTLQQICEPVKKRGICGNRSASQLRREENLSFLPFLINELIEERRKPAFSDVYDQNFGLGLLNDEVLRPTSVLMGLPLKSGYLRPWRSMAAGDSGVSTIESDENEFRITLDVQQFEPDELRVKLVDDFIVVEAAHGERCDQHGLISRQFTRRYKIPENVDKTALTSNLSSDGVLTLKAPKNIPPEKPFRDIPITQTNKPAVKPKDTAVNKKEENV